MDADRNKRNKEISRNSGKNTPVNCSSKSRTRFRFFASSYGKNCTSTDQPEVESFIIIINNHNHIDPHSKTLSCSSFHNNNKEAIKEDVQIYMHSYIYIEKKPINEKGKTRRKGDTTHEHTQTLRTTHKQHRQRKKDPVPRSTANTHTPSINNSNALAS